MICPCRVQYPKLIIAVGSKTDASIAAEYSVCCAPIHKDIKKALTPEAIMRARYSSYVQKNLVFLEESLDPQTRENFDPRSTKEWAESADFKGLKIIKTQSLGNKGIVEFKVAYQLKDEEIIHHEISQFRRHIGQWFFREGKIKAP